MYSTEPEYRRARKSHCCSTCLRKIDPGETYSHSRGFDGGDAWTFKQCAHCETVTKVYAPLDYDDVISYDGFDGWLDDGARDVEELRAMAGWRMQWRTRGGTLLPVPALRLVEGAKA